MQLIGMLDSPYVRRVAVSLQLLGLPFAHRSLSVFRAFEAFSRVNPVVKAPSLICADGSVLMDSSLILEYAESLAAADGRSLLPRDPAERLRTYRITSLALAGCEKSVQIIYERNLRPAEKLHQPWLDRVSGQLLAAFEGLEAELRANPLPDAADALTQAGVSAAVGWTFVQRTLPEVIVAAGFPCLDRLTATLECQPAFMRAPHGDGVVAVRDDELDDYRIWAGEDEA